MTITETPIPVQTGVGARVRKAHRHDRAAIGTTITAAFFDDPVTAWIIPDRAERPAWLPGIFDLYLDAFLPHGETYLTEDGMGAALWLPPGRELLAEDELEEFGRRTEQLAGPYASRLNDLGEFFDAHAPATPHWHLQLLAVRPNQQGRGLGSALMADVLPRADRAGEAVYLEATTRRARALYERHGFRFIGEITLPKGPTLWQMWREPR